MIVGKPTIIISCSEKKKNRKKAVTALTSENRINLVIIIMREETWVKQFDKEIRVGHHGRCHSLVVEKAVRNNSMKI